MEVEDAIEAEGDEVEDEEVPEDEDLSRSTTPKKKATKKNAQSPSTSRLKGTKAGKAEKQDDNEEEEDPLAILRPGRKKLGTLEAERIIAVLDTCIARMRLIPVLSHTNPNAKRLLAAVPEELQELLLAHHALEREYEASSDDGVGQELESSTRDVLRVIQRSSASLSSLLSFAPPPDQTTQALIGHVESVRRVTEVNLLTSVEEIRHQQDYVTRLLDKHRAQTAQIERLEEELVKAYEERDKEVEVRDEILTKLQAELEHIVSESADVIKNVDKDAQKKETREKSDCTTRVSEIQISADTLASELSNLRVSNSESEALLRKRRFKLGAEVETWVGKYDTEMSEKQKMIDEIQGQYEEEERQLAGLTAKFQLLEAHYNTIMEEKRLARERQKAADAELQRMIKAAVLLQGVWRAYRARKALKDAQEKKAKAKAKKKK